MSRARSTSDGETPQYDAIPRELKNREQWLLYDRASDTPRRPHWKGDFGISWSDPDEWHSFQEARDAAQTRETWGIGYVMAADNDDHTPGVYGCLDLDGALTDDGDLREWVPDLTPFTDGLTYIEYSPSGTGLHIPIDGTEVPEWWTDGQLGDHEGVDVLTNKFCTFTGEPHPDSGSGIAGIDPAPWLFEAYQQLHGEAPNLGDDAGREQSHNSGEYLEESDIEEALSKISPDLPHNEWVKIGYAVHDFDDGQTGRRLFEKWSQRGSKYDDKAERTIESIWSNASAGAGVTLGTLVHKAKANGWEPPTPEGGSPGSKGGKNGPNQPLAKSVGPEWFDAERQVVTVGTVADYDKSEVVDLFENPNELPTDVTLAVNEVSDGDAYLSNPEEWTVQERAPQDPLEVMSLQEQKNAALDEIPTERIAYLPAREEWFWCDSDGIWHRHGEENIRQWLDRYAGRHYRRQLRSEVMDQLKARVRTDETVFGGGPDGTIATESGLVNLQSRECREIKPRDRVRWKLGTEYDPEAKCPNWKEFLGGVAEPESIPMLQEYAGYCLHHWGLPFKKALILFGPTDAGKSVFLDVLRALFGGDDSPSTSSTGIQYLANERWGPARLVNTAVNIRNDLDSSTIENTGKVKELIAGDALDAERKRKPVFKFSPTAKHIFAANRAPDRNVDDEAFWNRWLTVMFPTSVPRSEQDPQLTDDLKEELPGILNWAIEGHTRLMEQGGFTDEPLPFENREKWERYGNSIEQFLERYTDADDGGVVPKRSTGNGTVGLYDSYLAYARQNGLERESLQKFTAEITKRAEVFQTKRSVDGNRERCYVGITLDDDAPKPQNGTADDDGEETIDSGLGEYQ